MEVRRKRRALQENKTSRDGSMDETNDATQKAAPSTTEAPLEIDTSDPITFNQANHVSKTTDISYVLH